MSPDAGFTYNAYFHPRLILWIARWGLDDKEIAAELGIPVTMLDDWKSQYPEVGKAIQDGKAYWFDLSEQSLQKLVKGYDYDETEIVLDANAGVGEQARPTRVRKFTRHVPPNAAAIIFLMKNSAVFRLAEQIDRSMLSAVPMLPKKT